jgi:hypothetical protein
MQKKYRGLRIIGLLLKIIGSLELVIGLVSLLIFPLVFSDPDTTLLQFGDNYGFPGSGLFFGVISGLLVFLCGIVCGLLTFSAGEIFNILIAIEENTRNTLHLLQKQEK